MSYKPGRVRALFGVALMIVHVTSCTHMPTGEKAFHSFESCVAANLGLAALGGVAVGILSRAVTRRDAVGATAGAATAIAIGMVAWRKCAAEYSTSVVIAPAPPQPAQPEQQPAARPQMSIDRLEVRVEGTEETPPRPQFQFSYADANPSAKDIKARFRHKVQIVRFTTLDDRMVLADGSGRPLRDASGMPIPIEQAGKMPRERLQWTTIAEEGKDDYVEEVVIQQGTSGVYQHLLQIPPRSQLPLPLPMPMRYTVTVEAGEVRSARTVDFALLSTQDRPKVFSAPSTESRT